MDREKKDTKIIDRCKWGTLYIIYMFLWLPVYAMAVDYTVQTIPNVRSGNRYNYVSNPDGIISTSDASRINQLLRHLEDSLSIEVAVVAVKSIGDNEAREFATDLFKHWGIGKREDDNGLLIQLITDPPNRSIVFETGYGIEGILPDAICYRLQQQYMIPDLRSGDYSSAMMKGVEAVSQYLFATDYERAAIAGSPSTEDMPSWLVLLIVFSFPIGILIIAMWANSLKNRPQLCPNCGKKALVLVKKDTIQAASYRAGGIVEYIYQCKNCGYIDRRRKNTDRLRSGGAGPVILGSPGGFGRGGGGSFGGGSFGGGRSGGGGSISRF